VTSACCWGSSGRRKATHPTSWDHQDWYTSQSSDTQSRQLGGPTYTLTWFETTPQSAMHSQHGRHALNPLTCNQPTHSPSLILSAVEYLQETVQSRGLDAIEAIEECPAYKAHNADIGCCYYTTWERRLVRRPLFLRHGRSGAGDDAVASTSVDGKVAIKRRDVRKSLAMT